VSGAAERAAHTPSSCISVTRGRKRGLIPRSHEPQTLIGSGPGQGELPSLRNSGLLRMPHPRTWLNGPLSRARSGEALRRESSISYLQIEPLFATVSLWGARSSRGDCSPLGWILVPLVGCISRDITSHPSGFSWLFCVHTDPSLSAS
jgi:hypothetical protein